MKLSEEKCVAISKNRDAACNTAKRLRRYGISVRVVTQAKHLGADYGAGRAAKRVTQGKRICVARARIDRIKRIKKNACVLKLARAGLKPSMLYAAGAFGVSDAALVRMRRIVGACTRTTVKGASLTLDLEMSTRDATAIDPAYEGNAAPLVAWARAVWQGRRSRSAMYSALVGQRSRVQAWRDVVGGG